MGYEKVERFKVGFNKRNDTYTQKLGFINPLVQEKTEKKKEKFKYEKSYENWRDHKITEEFFDNVPLSGFILNYKVGGHYYGWNEGREPKMRVLDPRGFEIEITLHNLVGLLEFGMSRGKLFDTEMIYIYKDGHLTLLSVEQQEYKELYDESRYDLAYDGSDYVVGNIYCTGEIENSNQSYMYLGQFELFENVKTVNGRGKWSKKHLFGSLGGSKKNVNLSSYSRPVTLTKSKIKFTWKTDIEVPTKEYVLKTCYSSLEDISDFNKRESYSYGGRHSERTTITTIKGKKDYIVSKGILINFKPISDLLEINGKWYYSQVIKIFGKEFSDNFRNIPDDKKGIKIKGYPPINFLISEFYKLGNKLQSAKFEKDSFGVSVLVWEDIDEQSVLSHNYNEFSSFKGSKIINKLLKKNGEVTE